MRVGEEGNIVTRFYFHQTTSSQSGTLPTTTQAARTKNNNIDALTTNKTMNTTISAVAQTDLSKTLTPTDPAFIYITRYISDPLGQTSLAANTWTLSIAAWASTALPWWPSNRTPQNIPGTLYIWRPSTGAKVSNVFDGNSSGTTSQGGTTTETTSVVTFTGVSGTPAVGDVLIYESWGTVAGAASSLTLHYAHNGTTASSSDNVPASNFAAYLQTPENLTFATPAVDATATTISNLTNKFITIV